MRDHQALFHKALNKLIPFLEHFNIFISSLQKKQQQNKETADDTKYKRMVSVREKTVHTEQS